MNMDVGGDELNEILEEFFTEADENLDTLEQDLIQLETLADGGETDKETVDRIFRMLHTLKGGAGFLGLEKIAKVAHSGENLLDEVRNERVRVTKPVMDALLQTTDMLKYLLQFQKSREDDSAVETASLVAVLTDLAAGKQADISALSDAGAVSGSLAAAEVSPAPVAATSAPAAAAPATGSGGFNLMDSVLNDPTLDPTRDKGEDGGAGAAAAPVVAAPAPAFSAPAGVQVNADLLASVLNDPTLDPTRDKGEDGGVAAAPAAAVAPVAAPVAAAPGVNADLLASVLNDPTLDPTRDKGEDGGVAAAPAAVAAPVAAVETAAAATAGPAVPRDVAAEQRKGEDRRQAAPRRAEESGGETIRVETARLDKVMNLVGELVLARNTLLRQLNDPSTRNVIEPLDNSSIIYGIVEQLSRVTQDLQMSVLSTRMQPIKKVFDKIPRQVRELKTQLKKEVNLIVEGEMTEVDKTLVEELADPMVHMIRNALDHGLEGPDERSAMGKHPEGTLVVRAFYEGNNVVIQVQEDGRGIDPVKIRKVAVKKGVVSEVVANAMSDEEAIRLIMAPGFSTAEKITDVSGRGVGMDVVNTKIANLQGSIEISSELGMGTCFSIYMPLTLAIVNALIVGAKQEGFAIPIGDISEVIKFNPDNIHRVNDQDVIELRGEPLPLFYLSKLTHHGIVKGPMPYNTTPAAPAAAATANGEPVAVLERVAADVAAPPALKKAQPSRGFVVVVREASASMGLVVDELLGQEEVVIKQVTNAFEYNKAISGATITGDGRVHMILDVPYLLKDLSGAR